jgi:hypothetical protein
MSTKVKYNGIIKTSPTDIIVGVKYSPVMTVYNIRKYKITVLIDPVAWPSYIWTFRQADEFVRCRLITIIFKLLVEWVAGGETGITPFKKTQFI